MNEERLSVARALGIGIVAVCAFAPGLAAAQAGYKADPQGKDELWDVTSKMEMPGMPMAMPGQTHRVCVPKGNDAGMIPRSDGCKVVDARHVGNKFSYRMECRSGGNDYAATGESTSSGNGYQGRMQMSGKMEGQPMQMSMEYSGTRAGNCTSTAK